LEQERLIAAPATLSLRGRRRSAVRTGRVSELL
jgi:hypothetical protein